MESVENYQMAILYETFIKRAWCLDNRIRRPSKSEFLNLIAAEQGEKQHVVIGSYLKQLQNMKDRLVRSINLFLTNNSNKEEVSILTGLLTDVEDACSYRDIINIVEKGLNCTQRFK